MATKAEIEQEVNERWQIVRDASKYPAVIAWAQAWLQAVWPYAHRLGYAPKGRGYDEYLLTNCPRIREKCNLPEGVAGMWSGGDFIWIATQKRMRESSHSSDRAVRDELRLTIIHEVQHAFDSLRNVNPRNGHDIWFARRLRKLEQAFPSEGN